MKSYLFNVQKTEEVFANSEGEAWGILLNEDRWQLEVNITHRDSDVLLVEVYETVNGEKINVPREPLPELWWNKRNDGVMDMTYDELSREPLFDDRDDDYE